MLRWLAAVAVVASGLAMVGAAAGPAAAATTQPAYASDFPDPFVLRVGSGYFAYSTGSAGRNLQVISSSNLTSWGPPRDPLPVLPAWSSAGNTWAPGVLHRSGEYVMYYTVRDTAYGRQCISVAVSTGARGPYTDRSTGPLICQLADGGSIDPVPFVNSNGIPYLVWKSDDNALGLPTKLWAQQLTSNGLGLTGPAVQLLTEDAASWQAPSLEGPAMVLSGGVYYVFYGAGNWDSAAAAIGYGTCSSPLGPCVDHSQAGPWLASHGNALGPSGPTVFVTTTGATDIAYHAWTGGVGYNNGGVRSLWIDGLTFVNGKPVIP